MSTQTGRNGTRSATITPMAIRPTAFKVNSESQPGVVYDVQLPGCTCPDFSYRRANKPEDPFCKHLKQAMSVAGWQVPGGGAIVIVIG